MIFIRFSILQFTRQASIKAVNLNLVHHYMVLHSIVIRQSINLAVTSKPHLSLAVSSRSSSFGVPARSVPCRSMPITCHVLTAFGPDRASSSARKRSWRSIYDSRPRSWNAKRRSCRAALPKATPSEAFEANIDGANEEAPPPTAAPQQAQVEPTKESTITDSAPKPAVFSSGRNGRYTVADRIRILNEARNASKPESTTTASLAAGATPRLEHKSTQLKNRMNPFIRRNSSGQAPELPAPTAKRRKPSLRHSDQPVSGAIDTSGGNAQPSNVKSGFGRRRSKDFKRVTRPVPVTAPSAGQITCPRHGRRLNPGKSNAATIEGLDKGLSGVYIPSGRRIRHQVELTSPWRFLEKLLTKTEGTSLSPEPCPDCLAEEEIRKREEAEGSTSANAGAPVPDLHVSLHEEEASSIITEPGTPLPEALVGSSLIGTSEEHEVVYLPGAAVSDAGAHQAGTLVAADLGDMIDAIIIEHRGSLNHVITNLRNGTPGPPEMQNLSRELSTVSDAIRSVDSSTCMKVDAEQRFSVILDTPPEFLRSRTKSIPDLLDFIDSAAHELGFSLPRRQERSRNRASDTTANNRGAARSLPVDSTALMNIASTVSLAPSSRRASPTLAGSAYATPTISPLDTPVLEAKTFMPQEATAISPGTAPTSLSLAGLADTRDGQAAGSTSTTKQPAPPTRIPSIRSLARAVTGTRKRTPGGIKLPAAPWSTDSTIPSTAVKPSAVKERQKQQEAATQPFATDATRDAARKERADRRARMGADIAKD